MPDSQGGLLDRLKKLDSYLQKHPNTFIHIIKQTQYDDMDLIQKLLKDISDRGGEGLVLRDLDAPYTAGRSKVAYKLKLAYDAECEIVGFSKGKGKYNDKVGAIICEGLGKRFKIGSGLNDSLRANPPSVGSVISFRYYGLTHNGMPRFPVFWRVKEVE